MLKKKLARSWRREPRQERHKPAQFNVGEMFSEGKQSLGWLSLEKTQSFDSLHSIVEHEAWCS
jgi:hypothetical protein